VISATVTSFYLPLAIMTVMYALTVRALQQQLKEQRRMTVTNSGRSRSSGLYGAFYADIFYASANNHHHHHHHHHQNAGFRVAHNNELLLGHFT